MPSATPDVDRLITARWILPVSSPPIAHGGVLVRGSRIAAVGRADELAERFPAARRLDLPTSALLPGLVNVHTHLELTLLRGRFEGTDFFSWIRNLTAAKECLGDEDFLASARWGAFEMLRGGVTTVADAGSSGQAVRAVSELGLRAIVHQEVFGPDPRQADDALAALRTAVELQKNLASSIVRVGISPHAPYTVSEALFRRVAELAVVQQLPVTVHVAESLAEEQLLLAGTGAMAERLRERGISWTAPGVSPVAYLQRTGLLAARPLLVHAIRLQAGDLALIAAAGASIAHCPKSNAKLRHGIAPLCEMLSAGVRTGLGTDGAVSNNACDFFEEGRFAALLQRARAEALPATLGQPDAAAMLRLMTLGGAEALQLETEIGSIVAGKAADFCAVDLAAPGLVPEHDPRTAVIFGAGAGNVVFTMVNGEVRWLRGTLPGIDQEAIRRGLESAQGKLSP